MRLRSHVWKIWGFCLGFVQLIKYLLILIVPSLVITFVADRCELLTAVRASVGLFTGVCTDVHLHISFFGKYFGAPFVMATIVRSWHIGMHCFLMMAKSVSAGEALLAIIADMDWDFFSDAFLALGFMCNRLFRILIWHGFSWRFEGKLVTLHFDVWNNI